MQENKVDNTKIVFLVKIVGHLPSMSGQITNILDQTERMYTLTLVFTVHI